MAEQNSKRRVVVTGMGVVTPIGLNVEDFWQGLHEARNGVSELGGFPLEDLKILIAAQIKDFEPKEHLRHFKRDKIILHADRYSWFAAAAADLTAPHPKCATILERRKVIRFLLNRFFKTLLGLASFNSRLARIIIMGFALKRREAPFSAYKMFARMFKSGPSLGQNTNDSALLLKKDPFNSRAAH